MYGTELWWKRTGNRGTEDGAEKLQKLVNQEARAVTGCFWRTNSGALVAEAGLRPATAQLDSRIRRYGLRLLSLPLGSQAKEILETPMGVGKRLKTALGYSGRTETTVLPERPGTLDAVVVMESQAEAIKEAGRLRQGLTIFTDGARAGNGAIGYAVVWKRRQQWVGIKSHMAYNQEAFDAECAALARALVADHTRTSHNFYGCSGGHPSHGDRRAGSRAEIRYRRQKMDRRSP
jgi:hypothetical protein